MLVAELRGPACHTKTRQQRCPDGQVSVLFEIPEAVTVSGETGYWIERPLAERVLVDERGRA